MASLNKALIIGNLGRDPEMRYTTEGLAIANFSIATTEKVKGEERTEWHKIITFGKLAEICGKYLVKGKQVYIEGKIQTRQWENKEGQKVYTTEIIANQMVMLGSKEAYQGNQQGYQGQHGGYAGNQAQGRGEAYQKPYQAPDQGQAPLIDDDSDVPF